MFTKKFGIENEFTGITRAKAAQVAAEYLGGEYRFKGGSYDEYAVTAPDGRIWKFVSDSSIIPYRKENGRIVSAGYDFRVEMVSPILSYREDIGTLQELIRRLRKAGAFAEKNCGIHVHLSNEGHTPRSILNFINIIASKNDLFYKALQISPERMRYCKKMDDYLVERMNKIKPKTFSQIESIWYEGYDQDRNQHYHSSRYNFLNLHALFTRNHTIELRGFNGDLHAGRVRSWIVLALALNNQALTQKSARSTKPQVENEKFAMRVFLNRIGFIGEEFKNCREHLCCHLSGNSAWRYRVSE